MLTDFNRPCTETLKMSVIQKLEFYKLQKINIALSYLLFLAMIILLSKSVIGRDITASKYADVVANLNDVPKQ